MTIKTIYLLCSFFEPVINLRFMFYCNSYDTTVSNVITEARRYLSLPVCNRFSKLVIFYTLLLHIHEDKGNN